MVLCWYTVVYPSSSTTHDFFPPLLSRLALHQRQPSNKVHRSGFPLPVALQDDSAVMQVRLQRLALLELMPFLKVRRG